MEHIRYFLERNKLLHTDEMVELNQYDPMSPRPMTNMKQNKQIILVIIILVVILGETDELFIASFVGIN